MNPAAIRVMVRCCVVTGEHKWVIRVRVRVRVRVRGRSVSSDD